MDNRYRTRTGQHDYRDRYGSRERQTEQFSSGGDWQPGDDNWRGQGGQRWQTGDDHDRGYERNENAQREDFTRAGSGYRGDTSSLDDYDQSNGPARYNRQGSPRQSYGGGNYGGSNYGSGRADYARSSENYGSSSSGSIIPPRQYDHDERGFFDRASDEVMSWLGDDDAARRRKMDSREDHRGRGPANYARSSERLQEDACERLTRDPHIDASKINVTCTDNEVTLDGTVDSRSAKRRAEDIVDDISGVKHVQNNLRVEARDSYYGQTSTGTVSES